jgi:hypothetical protein
MSFILDINIPPEHVILILIWTRKSNDDMNMSSKDRYENYNQTLISKWKTNIDMKITSNYYYKHDIKNWSKPFSQTLICKLSKHWYDYDSQTLKWVQQPNSDMNIKPNIDLNMSMNINLNMPNKHSYKNVSEGVIRTCQPNFHKNMSAKHRYEHVN